mgnify:CR=1 FL=1
MITQKQTLQIIHDLLLTIINIKEKTMFAENICKNCGKELIPEQDFCSDCGTKIKKTETELYIEKLERELADIKKELSINRYLCWFGFINQTTEDLTITWKVNDGSLVKKNQIIAKLSYSYETKSLFNNYFQLNSLRSITHAFKGIDEKKLLTIKSPATGTLYHIQKTENIINQLSPLGIIGFENDTRAAALLWLEKVASHCLPPIHKIH